MTLFLKGSLPVLPTLNCGPLTESKSVAIRETPRNLRVPLALNVVPQTGEVFVPGVIVGVPGPARECLEPPGALFFKGSLLVAPTLHAHPLAEPESAAIAVSHRYPTVCA